MRKKLISLVLGMSMMAAAVGCSSKPKETEKATEAKTEVKTEVVTEAPEETEAATEAAAAAEETVSEAAVVEEAVSEAASLAGEAEEAVTEGAKEEAEEAVTEAAEEEDLTEEADADEEVSIRVVLDTEPVRGTVDDFDIHEDDIVVLYTNDVHGGISADKEYSGSASSLGYAGLAGVKEEVTGKAADVTTVDLGDATQGSVVTTESDGHDAMDLMDLIGYDIRVPGNHEFDYGMEAFLDYAESTGDFICCNFIDLRSGEPVFEGYTLATYDVNGVELTVGYVGMDTPESITKSTPAYFEDEDGNLAYSFSADTPQALYDRIQENVDAAREDGADLVIALGHMGDVGVEKRWSSPEVIRNTTGISAFLDGHAHSVIPGEVVENKDGEEVILASTGTKLEHIGVLRMCVAEDGTVTLSTGLVDEITDAEKEMDDYNEVYGAVQKIEDALSYLFVKLGRTDFDLVIEDPETGEKIIRNRETNLGDFLADVMRNYFKTDIGIMNGGSIRSDFDEGDIVFMDIVNIYPWSTPLGVAEVTGQQILDCLEMGARFCPEACGGWIHPSGLTYMVDTTIESNVQLDSSDSFVSVDGEYRVKNVMAGDEPLDPDRKYTLAVSTYYSRDFGDGMSMFKGCRVLVPGEGGEAVIDQDVLADYLKSIPDRKIPEEYRDPYGQGRVTIITEENRELLEEAAEAVTEAAEEGEEELTEAVTESVK